MNFYEYFIITVTLTRYFEIIVFYLVYFLQYVNEKSNKKWPQLIGIAYFTMA